MRILLDESVDLASLLVGHDVSTVPGMGWASVRNGDLLASATTEGFDVFVTPDQSLSRQQSLSKFDIAIVVLAAGRNRMATYRPLADRLRMAVGDAKRGEALWFKG